MYFQTKHKLYSFIYEIMNIISYINDIYQLYISISPLNIRAPMVSSPE